MHLKILDLRQNTITDISSLENMKGLKELNLRQNNIIDISALSGLKELEYLNIHSNYDIKSVAPLADLTNLNTLIMPNVAAWQEASLLSKLTGLKRLNMRSCYIPDISFIAGFGKLEELDLGDNYIEDVSALDGLINLKMLDLSKNYIGDITVLKSLSNLQELNLRENRISDISPLSVLKGLLYLNIHSNYDVESIRPVESLTNLQTLIMENVDAVGKDIEVLKNLVNLKILNTRHSRVKDISAVSGFSQLEEIYLSDNSINSFEDLSVLNSLNNLKILDLRENYIEDITALGKISTLEKLNLRENEIIDITPLSTLKKLEYLNIHSNYNITSIEPIANLTNLKTLIMENVKAAGKDIEKLANLVNLKRLNVRNCLISDISALAVLMNAGALQDDNISGEIAAIDIIDNPVFNLNRDIFDDIRPYWHNIRTRAPFILPTDVDMVESPVFSPKGGFYKDGFLLELSISDPEAKIFYTLDGSEPTASSDLYTGPIKIDNRKGEPNKLSEIRVTHYNKKPGEEVFKITVIKARAFKNDSMASSVITNTYIIDEKNEGFKNRYSLPLISITTDEDYLFDYDYGILVPGVYFDKAYSVDPGNYFQRGSEWERPVYIEFFEPDGTLGFSQNAGIRVHGNSTRYIPNKSFRIYASNLYDEKEIFDYPIFPGLLKNKSSQLLTQFKTFILRNSGNDYNSTFFRDGVLQTLVSHLGFDTQAYRPAIIFINGEYWGIYNIREYYDDWYFLYHYGVDTSKIVFLDNDLEVTFGETYDNLNYFEMVQFIKESAAAETINDTGIYDCINSRMDIDNFIKYFASQIFIGNSDWPRNNSGCWRTKTESYESGAPYGQDGRWRWVMVDIDSSFGTISSPAEKNSIASAEKYSELFRLLLKNEQLKYQFINTMADLMNSVFKTEYTVQKIKDAQSVLEPEMLEHLKRWSIMDISIEKWDANIQYMLKFANDRPLYQIQHINEFFSLNGTAEINLITDSQKGYIKINTLELKEDIPGIESPANWKGIYFKEVPVQLTAVPYTGYKFSGWSEIGNNNSSISLSLNDDMTLTAVFEDV